MNGHGLPGWGCKRNFPRLTIYVKVINDVFLLFFWNRWYYLIKTYSWTMRGQHCPRAGYLKNDERTSRIYQRVESWPWMFLAQASWIILWKIWQGKHVAGQPDRWAWFVCWGFFYSWSWNWIKKAPIKRLSPLVEERRMTGACHIASADNMGGTKSMT